jgi:hypothetical protein
MDSLTSPPSSILFFFFRPLCVNSRKQRKLRVLEIFAHTSGLRQRTPGARYVLASSRGPNNAHWFLPHMQGTSFVSGEGSDIIPLLTPRTWFPVEQLHVFVIVRVSITYIYPFDVGPRRSNDIHDCATVKFLFSFIFSIFHSSLKTPRIPRRVHGILTWTQTRTEAFFNTFISQRTQSGSIPNLWV